MLWPPLHPNWKDLLILEEIVWFEIRGTGRMSEWGQIEVEAWIELIFSIKKQKPKQKVHQNIVSDVQEVREVAHHSGFKKIFIENNCNKCFNWAPFAIKHALFLSTQLPFPILRVMVPLNGSRSECLRLNLSATERCVVQCLPNMKTSWTLSFTFNFSARIISV